MPIVSIHHTTTYRYRVPVAFGEHRMMLRPMEAFDQRLLSAEVEISPEPSLLRHIHDASGAAVGVARFAGRADRLVFAARMRVDHAPGAPFELEASSGWVAAGLPAYGPEEAQELAAAIAPRQPGSGEVEAWARRFLRAHGRTRASTVLAEMMEAIRGEFAYALRLRGAPQTPAETLARRQGSCRDFAVLMMEAARSLGLAAQFVTGYVYTASQKIGRTGGSHTHAWARAYLPGCGWTDFDPTNGIIGNLDLIRVAVVSDPRLALPLHGVWEGAADDFAGMDVTVDVTVEPEAQRIPDLRVALAR
jgi:transglutaminase-like putative cysteine protease